MSKVFTFRARAREDIFAQQAWYMGELAFDIAERFVEAVVTSAQKILENPGTGRLEQTSNP